MLNGLIHLRDRQGSVLCLLAGGVLCIGTFVANQARRDANALLNMRLFARRQFALSALVSFIYGMGLFGSTCLLPVYFQLGLHFTPGRDGLALLPAGLALAITLPLAGRLVGRVTPSAMIVFGLTLLASSSALMAGTPMTPHFGMLAGHASSAF